MSAIFNSYLFIAIFLFAVLGFWGIGMWFGLHFIFWWYDVAAHLAGGAWVMSLAFLLKNKLGIEAVNLKGFVLFIAMSGIVAIAAIFWEFFEFIMDRYIFFTGFSYLPGVYGDTLSDLFFGLAGGAIIFFVL